MARTERANEFMRNFRLAHLDTYCERDDCHGTHVDRLDWEIALRRTKELGTEDVIAELAPEEGRLVLWVAYVSFVREQYSGVPSLIPPPARRASKVVIPPEVAEAGLDQEAVDAICWICDEPECPICNWSEGNQRLQRLVLRERRVLSRLGALNNERNMKDFLEELHERTEEANAS